MKILVIAAHPDDEILGVGGTLFKHKKAGDEIFICIMTKGYEPAWTKEYMEQKKVEQKKVDKLIGVTKRYNLDFHATKLNNVDQGELNKKVTEVVNEIKPDIVYTHFEHDVHNDHTLTFKTAIVATRPPHKIKLICFETVSETEWSDKAYKSNYWVDITKFIDKKIDAFKIYDSEIKKGYHPRSLGGIKNLAKLRGNEICREYAESFKIIRDIC